jgi:hypothetical protein
MRLDSQASLHKVDRRSDVPLGPFGTIPVDATAPLLQRVLIESNLPCIGSDEIHDQFSTQNRQEEVNADRLEKSGPLEFWGRVRDDYGKTRLIRGSSEFPFSTESINLSSVFDG